MWTGKGDARNGDNAYAVYGQQGELIVDGLTYQQMITICMVHNKQLEAIRRIVLTVTW